MCENSADLCNVKEISGVKVCLSHIYDALRSLVPFLQFKKLKPPTLLLNCTNGLKLLKGSHLLNLYIK